MVIFGKQGQCYCSNEYRNTKELLFFRCCCVCQKLVAAVVAGRDRYALQLLFGVERVDFVFFSLYKVEDGEGIQASGVSFFGAFPRTVDPCSHTSQPTTC